MMLLFTTVFFAKVIKHHKINLFEVLSISNILSRILLFHSDYNPAGLNFPFC